MNWLLKQGNILDEPADALICSANVNLTLSGGVGADLLARYGNSMQKALQEVLSQRTPRCAERGEVIPYVGSEIPYKVTLNAVAINGWYESSTEIITTITRKALGMAAEKGARRITLTALATGFGRLSLADFASGIRPLLSVEIPRVEEVLICLLLDFEVAELAHHLPEIKRVPPLTNSLTH